MNFSQSVVINIAAAVASFFVLYFFTNMHFYSMLGIVQFVFFSSKFFNDLGRKIDIRDMMVLIATLQWLIGPVLAYQFIVDDPIFYMAVDEETYMSFVFPATFAFSLGLYLPIWKKTINENLILLNVKNIVNKYPNLDLIFIFGGIFLTFAHNLFPDFLRFFIYLLASVRFVGLYFLILRDRPFKWYIFAFVLLSFVSVSFRDAMFHDLLLWIGFMIIILAFIYRISVFQKFMLAVLGVVLILSIQLVKGQFRQISTSNRTIGQFYDMASESLQNENLVFSDAFINYNISRINQGWIIARIMDYVPTFEPFAEGETIWRGLKASLLPRFLLPELKTFAGHSEYFQRFTGQRIARGTSMDISILGEAYANYGVFGGVVFMLILGLFYNFILFKIFSLSIHYPSLLLMLPIMFLHVIKAETDFSTTMNFLVKAIMVIFGIFLGLKSFFGMKI